MSVLSLAAAAVTGTQKLQPLHAAIPPQHLSLVPLQALSLTPLRLQALSNSVHSLLHQESQRSSLRPRVVGWISYVGSVLSTNWHVATGLCVSTSQGTKSQGTKSSPAIVAPVTAAV